MANTVNILGFANTFGDWIVATNADSNEINSIGKYNWTKDSGTLTLNGTGTSLSVGNNAIVQGQLQVTGTSSSATIDNNLTVGKQVYLTNTAQSLVASGSVTANGTVYANNTGTGLAVANNTTIGGTLTVSGATTISNTLNVTKATVLQNTLSVGADTTITGNLNTTLSTYTNSLQANASVNTSVLSATSATYTNTLQANTSVLTGTVQANTSVNTAVVSVTGTTYTNALQANTSVNTAVVSVTGTTYTNALQANTSVNTATISVTGAGYVNTLQANLSVNTSTLSVNNGTYTNTLQANTSVLTGTVQANTSVNTATLSVTGTSFTNNLQANSSVNTATLSVTGASYTNTLQANTSVLTGSIQANSSVNTATLSVSGTSYTNTLQSNSSINTAAISVTGASYTNTLQSNTSILTGTVQANTSVNTATLTVTGSSITNSLQSNTLVNTAAISVTGNIYTNNLLANTSVNTNSLIVTGASVSATNAVGAFQSLTTTGGLTVGGSFTINGTTIYTSNNFVINANTFTPITSYFSVNRGTANNQYNGVPNANASIRWNETSKYWDILDVNNNNIGTQYSQIMTANMISDTTSTSTTTVPTNRLLNSVYIQANSGFDKANSAALFANGAFTQANTANNVSISAGLFANSSFDKANSDGLFANAAFTVANNALANTGASVVVNGLSVYTFVNTTSSISNTTGSVVISGGLGVRGNVYTGNVVITGTNNSITFPDGTMQYTAGSPTAALFANSAFDKANSAALFANGAFTQANTANNIAANGAIFANAAFVVANNALANTGASVTVNGLGVYTFSNTTSSTSNTTGAVVVGGGLGVKGNVYSGMLAITGAGNGITFQDGTLQTTAGLSNTGTLVYSNSLTSFVFTNTTSSTSNTTGAVVITGGLGVRGNVYTGNVFITGSGNGIVFQDGTVQTTAGSPTAALFANAAFTQANTANNIAANSAIFANAAFVRANNSLNVQSGGTITGDLSLTGNLFVNGSTSYINVATFQTVDSLIELASNNLSDSVDIGFYGQYVSSGTKYSGLVRTAASNWTLFQGITTNPTSNSIGTITYTNYGTLNANIAAGQITSSQPIGSPSGGTGIASPTANSLLVANGTGAMKLVAPGLSGNVVMSDGTNWYSGAAAPTVSFSNDLATATPVYPLFSSATTGSATSLYTSNARLLYTPSTGEFKSNTFIATNGMIQNSNTVSSNYTIAAGNNGLSAGPMTVASGTSVTVSSGAVWTIV